jgi:hypothetical protein
MTPTKMSGLTTSRIATPRADHPRRMPTRLRAHRWGPEDVPWIARVTFDARHDAHLINISSTGLLVASAIPCFPGRPVACGLWGPDLDLKVPSRVMRSRAHATSRGLSYHVAIAFDEPITRIAPVVTRGPLSRIASGGLTRLIAAVNGAADRGHGPDAWRRAFEDGLRRLVAAEAVALSDAPRQHAPGLEAIYFTVPTACAPHPILQATFDAAHPVRREDFELLEAAAVIAAEVVELDAARREDDGRV